MRTILVRMLILSAIVLLIPSLVGCSSDRGQVSRSAQTDPPSGEDTSGTEIEAASDEASPATALLDDPGFRPIGGFTTDFSRATVRPDEIISGGPPKDGIPAVDEPRFITVEEADDWLGSSEPVFAVSADGETKLYPVQILMYHEIVNDVVGETPVTVTYCPLCNSGLVFLRDFDGRVFDFGTTGRLRLSNLVMYDRQTESWWQQATGEGLVGAYAGFRLELYPMLMLPWDRARERFQGASVLSRETGHSRPYGNNPYAGYDTSERPFLYNGPRTSGPYAALDRVLSVVRGGQSAAFGYPELAEKLVVQRNVGGDPIVVMWEEGTASALDSRSIREGRDVGTANAFIARVDSRTLTFEAAGGEIRDVETGTTWDASGAATRGVLKGRSLEPAVGVQHFWFSYSAFERDGRWEPLE